MPIALLQRADVNPKCVLADAGYDSAENFRYVYQDLGATPVIKMNRRRGQKPSARPSHHSKAIQEIRDIRLRFGHRGEDDEFAPLYRRRQAIERLFGRAKDFRRLNHLTMRGIEKATVHCFFAMLTLLAHALAALLLDLPGAIRGCV